MNPHNIQCGDGALAPVCWPASRLAEALDCLARESGLVGKSDEAPPSPPEAAWNDSKALDQWLVMSAARLGFEVEAAEASAAELEAIVPTVGPALWRVSGLGEPRYLALLPGRGRSATVLGPDRLRRRLSLPVIRAALVKEPAAPLAAELDRLLDGAGIAANRRERCREAILNEHLGGERLTGLWLLRLSPGASVWAQAKAARLPGRLLNLMLAHFAQYGLWLLAWWFVGKAALEGHFDPGWFAAWAIVLLGLVPFRSLVTWSQGMFAILGGGLLKQRLLYGALKLEPEEIWQEGSGQLLGRVLESAAVESLALSGGFLGLMAGMELAVAAIVLGMGAGGWLQAGLLLAWIGLAFWLAWNHLRCRAGWTRQRLLMTTDLVERMAGHRTRLAQETPDQWHRGEDEAVENYAHGSRALDRSTTLLLALVPRGWLVVGLGGLAPAFVGQASSAGALAVSLGGILLAYRALQKLTAGLNDLAGAAIAWKQVVLLFRAAARPENVGAVTSASALATGPTGTADRQTLIEAHGLVFRYRAGAEPVLNGCDLRVQTGDRVLLEGPSGAGKSTFVSLLSSLRVPESGLVLLRGLDRLTLGTESWRRLVSAAPQFHENHVLTGTFAFNLLMGRNWPPQREEFDQAEALCQELGLGGLLRRMPAGLLQMVGESGWQLSHGEKSRLYIARALLQGTDLIMVDESFAALDPESLRVALQCVLARARTLLVIAHP